MTAFAYRDGKLHCESVSLESLTERYGTPLYVYSSAAIRGAYETLDRALGETDHLICYSMKPNSNLAIARLLVSLGSGLDVFSEGELFRALRAGAPQKKIIFGGVGKSAREIDTALKEGVLFLSAESADEIDALDARARALGTEAPLSLRVNPNVDPKTHPYISTGLRENKFGIEIERARELYHKASRLRGLKIVGVGFHIGSQII
ncbi:MAG: diaminopimelate decarboxylase family protein, partial [Vicinamibacteria bacterium]